MQAADIFILPSEAQGLLDSVIEAALAGLPIVTCEIDGVVDIIDHQESGILVPTLSPEPVAEAIQSLILSPEQAGAYGQVLRINAEQIFRVDAMVNSFARLYEQITGQD